MPSMAQTRSYPITTTAGTGSATITIAQKGRIKRFTCNVSVATAAAILELSTSPSTQTTSAQPVGVLARFPISDLAMNGFVDLDFPVDTFTYLYIHQSGAAAVAVCNIVVQS